MQTGEELIYVVSSNVRRLRHSAGMTVKVAAERGGLHPRTWQKLEAGANVKVEVLAAVSVGLEVDVTVLLEEPPEGSSGPSQRPRKRSVSGSRTTSTVSGPRRSSRSSKPRTPRRSTAVTGTR